MICVVGSELFFLAKEFITYILQKKSSNVKDGKDYFYVF